MNFKDFNVVINSPEELFDYMVDNFSYNYEMLPDDYRLLAPEQTFEYKSGICFDMVEFERSWFESHEYEVKTYFEMVQLNYQNPYPTHSFLLYKDTNYEWCLFEVADEGNAGIYVCDDLGGLLDFQLGQYLSILDSFGIRKDELDKVIQVEFDKPKFGITFYDYIEKILNVPRGTLES